MTNSTTEYRGKGESIVGVLSVWPMTGGSDDSPPPPIPKPRNATNAVLPIEGWRSSMITAEPMSTRSPPSGDGVAIPAISEDGELDKILLEGWHRGWLRVQPPACQCSATTAP